MCRWDGRRVGRLSQYRVRIQWSKNYEIHTADDKQIVKVKGFTLNYVVSNQLNFDVMIDMAISDEQHSIKIVGTCQIN